MAAPEITAGQVRVLVRLRDGDYIVKTDEKANGYTWLLGAGERSPYVATVQRLERLGLIETAHDRGYYWLTDAGRALLLKRGI